MKRIKIIMLAGLLTAVVALPLFYTYGRSLWVPFYIKVQGGRTIAEVVETLKEEKGLSFDPTPFRKIVILGLKSERVLEVLGITRKGEVLLIDSFPFTAFSGKLGPKLREGDRQIPEGIYSIEGLNPNSNFHLSMKVDYPNRFDREKGEADGRKKLGYDIFIHGKQATVGCIPIGDDAIEKLFLMVSEMGIENVDVILSPYDMRTKTETIKVDAIEWEAELYAQIRAAMEPLQPRP